MSRGRKEIPDYNRTLADKTAEKDSLALMLINDPLGHTHSLASSEHCFRLKLVLIG